jgi:hypothetical protein
VKQPPPRHATRLVTPAEPVRPWLGNQPIPIDEGIAGLIGECWRQGIVTVSCCQHGLLTSKTEITFFHHRHATPFMNAVLQRDLAGAPDLSDDLTRRARNWQVTGEPAPYPWRDGWEYQSAPELYPGGTGWLIEVRFPGTDIGEVTQRLRAATARGEPCQMRIPA